MSDERELRKTLEKAQGRVKALESELQTIRAELAKPRPASDAEFLALTAEVQRLRLLEAAPDAERALSELRAEVHRLRASTERAAAAEGAQRELRADVNQLTQERLELRASVKHLEAAARERRSRPAPSNYDGARQAGEVATLKHERDQLKAKLKEITTERDQLKSTGSSPMKKSTP